MHQINPDLLPLAVDITTLTVLANNPRKGDIEAVKKSYEMFGQRKPIVVRRADNVVLAGNHQLLAARALDWDKIAVVMVDDDENTANAFVLADNRTSDLGGYDDSALLALLLTLDNNLEGTGYTTDYLDELAAFIAIADSALNFDPTDHSPATERIRIAADRAMINVIVMFEDRSKLYELLKGLEWVIDARDAVNARV